MRKKSFFTLSGTALFLLSAVFLMHSCVKDSFVDTVENKSLEKEMHLNTAKQWFQMESSKHTTIGRSITSRSVGNEGYYSISLRGEPSWKYYAINMNDSLIVTDVDVTDRINQDFVLKNNLNTYKKSGKMPFRRSYTRFVHIENKRTGEQKGFYMTIVPSRYYVKAYNHRIRINTYLKRDKYLGGYVLFHNMEGKFTGGWEYKSGKITGKILPSGVASDNIAKRKLSLIKLPARYEVKPRMYSPYRSRSIGEDIPPDDKIDIFLDEVVVESERWEPDKGLHTDPWQYEYPYGDPDPDILNPDPDDYYYGMYYDDEYFYSEISDSDNSLDHIDYQQVTNSRAIKIIGQMVKDMCDKQLINEALLNKIFPNFNFSQIILNLFDKSSKMDLVFKEAKLQNSNGSTNMSTITLSEDYLKKATTLSIARTIIHEMVHAYLNVNYYKTDLTDKNFLVYLRNYFNTNYTGYSMKDAQHEFMGRYVDAIALSLQEWDKRHGTGGNLGWEYYKAMSYGGLYNFVQNPNDPNNPIRIDSDAFKQLVPKEQDRNDIVKKIYNEQEGNSLAKGTK